MLATFRFATNLLISGAATGHSYPMHSTVELSHKSRNAMPGIQSRDQMGRFRETRSPHMGAATCIAPRPPYVQVTVTGSHEVTSAAWRRQRAGSAPPRPSAQSPLTSHRGLGMAVCTLSGMYPVRYIPCHPARAVFACPFCSYTLQRDCQIQYTLPILSVNHAGLQPQACRVRGAYYTERPLHNF